MSMRISDPVLFCALPLMLAGCNKSQEAPAPRSEPAGRATPAAARDDRIFCARGNAAMTRSCTVEQTQGTDGLILTIRHPDGSFRRLLATQDGRGVIAADGAQTARVGVVGNDGIEVTLGDARYRLPATVKP